MQSLEVYLIQADLTWENETENLRHLESLVAETNSGSLVILPEMFATAFTMNPAKLACNMNGAPVKWLKDVSAGKAVCGSLAIEDNGKFYNRLIWAEDGEIKGIYNKRHLFGYGNENRHYTAGNERFLTMYRGWKIAPFICYDLRFPVWCRNTEEADLMIFTANWPQARVKAWKRLLQARAIENQCYVAGVNRVGDDGNGIYHNGQSGICDAWGEWINSPSDGESVIRLELESGPLLEFRRQFPVLRDRDDFRIV